MRGPRIAIIGAGLQGSSIALALAARGYPCQLFERASAPMQEASLRNEGKIHLGFVYALDPHGQTQRAMLEGALSFGPLLEAWCGSVPWRQITSSGFRYAVMPDSLASRDALISAYTKLRLDADVVSSSLSYPTHYLGTQLSWLWREAEDFDGAPRAGLQGLIDTQELSVDPRALSTLVQERLAAAPLVEIFSQTHIESATRQGSGFLLRAVNPLGTQELQADIVINCTWHDRLRLDESVGISKSSTGSLDAAEMSNNYRVKYQILVKPSDRSPLRPITMVQGPYGDLVPWNDGLVYLSWYPVGRTYFSNLPPPLELLHDKSTATLVAKQTLQIMGEFFPSLCGARIVSSLPGVIFANASRDVHDLTSGLHSRTAFGALHNAGWWSVNPGKLTTAPLVADKVVKTLVREL